MSNFRVLKRRAALERRRTFDRQAAKSRTMRLILLVLAALALGFSLLILSKATLRHAYAHSLMFLVHIPGRPDLNDWAMHLRSNTGIFCCDSSEATPIIDADWRNTDVDKCARFVPAPGGFTPKDDIGHQCVRVGGQWWLIPDKAVINAPNRYGVALLWGIWVGDGAGRQYYIRCFLPGAGA